MGSGTSAPVKGKDIQSISVPDTLDTYPPPKPPVSRKSDVFKESDYAHIDSRARTAPHDVSSDYGSLFNYLFEDLKTDMQMLRAIFSWLGAQDIARMNLGNVKDSGTPAGYMKLIQMKQGSYAAFFVILCREARFPCVIVRGKAKAVGYEPGDRDMSKMIGKWNAVNIGGSWRLVHPLWAFTGVKGQNNGKWTVIEKKGEGHREHIMEDHGVDVQGDEEFFFLTDPEQFVNLCLAQDESWQLLKKPWTEEQFVESPCYTPEYFSSCLKLKSPDTCDLVAKNGVQVIRFEHPKDKCPSLSYELLCDEEGSDEQLPDSTELERYVLENSHKNTKALFLRLPVRGVYKLRVFGGDDVNPPHICDFRIRCDDTGKNNNPFPLQTDIGYGYQQDAKDAGLVTTSAYSGIVVMEHGQRMTFEFNVDRPVEFETKLHHRDKDVEDLDKYVEKHVTNKKAEITVTMPEKGLTEDSEYALEINTRDRNTSDKNTSDKNTSDSYRNVCNYFLTPDKTQWKADSDAQPNNRTQRTVAVVQQKPAPRQRPKTPIRSESPRLRMRDATYTAPIVALDRSIRDFEKSDLKEKESDLTKAKERLVQLKNDANREEKLRQQMRDDTDRDSIEDLEKSIKEFEEAGVEEKDGDLTRAKERLAKLKQDADQPDETAREAMRDATDKESIEDLEKSIEEFEKSGLPEKDDDLTLAKAKLAKLKDAANKKPDETARKVMREATDGDSIEDLEKAIKDFEESGLDEKDKDLTLAKDKLAKLKNDAYKEPDEIDETAREAMRDATDYGSPEELEKAIKEFESSDLPEKDEDLTKAKQKLAEMRKKGGSEEDKLRQRLTQAVDAGDTEAINDALADCKDAGLQDDKGDIAEAEQKLMDKLKDKLEEARRERDADKLQQVLEEAEQSAVANKLDDTEDFQEAKETNEQLARMKTYNRQVMDLNPRLVSEIGSYKRPKPCIHDVLKATYIMLGEQEQDLTWRHITKQMKCIGQKNVIRRVSQFDVVNVEDDQAKKADRLISKYDLNEVMRNSQGTGTFYKWTRNVVDEMKKSKNEE